MQFLAYGELKDIFQLADSLSSVYFDNKNYCGYQQLHASFAENCLKNAANGKSKCSPTNVLSNLTQKHLMDVLAVTGVLGELYKTMYFDGDSQDMFEQTLEIGKQLGTLFASAIDF